MSNVKSQATAESINSHRLFVVRYLGDVAASLAQLSLTEPNSETIAVLERAHRSIQALALDAKYLLDQVQLSATMPGRGPTNADGNDPSNPPS